MSDTLFAMVEELAFLVRDSLPCKHLVLSMEDALVSFLQDNSSTDGIIELEPMDPYSRLLLHRLADIFGFAHVSVGEGYERHLILERCPETSVPSILVSDILFQCDESQPVTTSHQLLRRENAPSVLKEKSPSFLTLKEREAAYLAARERIFSMDAGEMSQPQMRRPRNVPVVARRMIAHALGQKISPNNQEVSVANCEGYEVQTIELNVQDKDKIDLGSNSENSKATIYQPQKKISSPHKAENNTSSGQRNIPREHTVKGFASISISDGPSRNRVKDYLKEDHVGAAKRMFAHALGLQSTKAGLARGSARKQVNAE